MQRDRRGLALSTASAEAAGLFDRAVQEFLEYRTAACATLARARAADPELGLATCLEAYLLLFQATERVLGRVAEIEAALDAAPRPLDARERHHRAAIGHWAAGDLGRAVATLGELLAIWPHDLLAARIHHQLAFVMGRQDLMASMARTLVERSSPALEGHGFLLGMRAFAEEEQGDYAAAERLGRAAVEANPDDLWSRHAVAHVLEMSGRAVEGGRWLAFSPERWSDRTVFRAHLWWHAALFAIETEEHARALALYDAAIRPGEQVYAYDLHNCCSLLARLEMAGTSVGDRWGRLAAHAAAWATDHRLALTDVHTALALARTRHPNLATLEASLADLGRRPEHWLGQLADPLLLPLVRAIAAHYDGRPAVAVDLLLPLRSRLVGIGGSNAQRDLLEQLLLEAALAAGRPGLARRLAAERVAERPSSLLRRRKLAAIERATPRPASVPAERQSAAGWGTVALARTV